MSIRNRLTWSLREFTIQWNTAGFAILVSLIFVGLAALVQAGHAPVVSQEASTEGASKQQILTAYGKLPLSFEANQGQTDRQVMFLSRGRGYTLFLTPTDVVLSLISPQSAPRAEDEPSGSFFASSASYASVTPSEVEGSASSLSSTAATVLRMKFLGANPQPEVSGLDQLPGKSNYFIGNNPTKWRTNIPHYAKVEYRGVYPGIDVVFYGHQRQLEYDFVVAPGADPEKITLGFDGADKLQVDARGDLVLQMAKSQDEIRMLKPYVYQEVEGVRREIPGAYVLRGKHQVSFRVAAYDLLKPLIIDPVFPIYSTYLGGSSSGEVGLGIAVDAAGNAYVTGITQSIDFPTTMGAFDTTSNGGIDAFVAKLNPAASPRQSLVYCTYLGGSGFNISQGIAVDAAGNAYVTGYIVGSTDFPTTVGAFDTTFNGFQDAFVTKLNSAGSALVYSTFLGGSFGDFGRGIAVDAAGNAYVTGTTFARNFPTTLGAFGPILNGLGDAFVTKLNPGGSALVYSTYLGGNEPDPPRTTNIDRGGAIAVDAVGNVYVTGTTVSSDFPTTMGAFDTTFNGGSDAFVTKLNPVGSGLSDLVYSTFLGGRSNDRGLGIAVDAAGNVYVTGNTQSSDFPTTMGAFDTTSNAGAFVAKFNPTASGAASLLYSTLLAPASAHSIAVDAAGNAYVTGTTGSSDFPTTPGAFGPILNKGSSGGFSDAFVTKFNAAGSALVYSTFLGGRSNDRGLGIAVNAAGNAYVTGGTASNNFPNVKAFQPRLGGSGNDAFVTVLQEVP